MKRTTTTVALLTALAAAALGTAAEAAPLEGAWTQSCYAPRGPDGATIGFSYDVTLAFDAGNFTYSVAIYSNEGCTGEASRINDVGTYTLAMNGDGDVRALDLHLTRQFGKTINGATETIECNGEDREVSGEWSCDTDELVYTTIRLTDDRLTLASDEDGRDGSTPDKRMTKLDNDDQSTFSRRP